MMLYWSHTSQINILYHTHVRIFITLAKIKQSMKESQHLQSYTCVKSSFILWYRKFTSAEGNVYSSYWNWLQTLNREKLSSSQTNLFTPPGLNNGQSTIIPWYQLFQRLLSNLARSAYVLHCIVWHCLPSLGVKQQKELVS